MRDYDMHPLKSAPETISPSESQSTDSIDWSQYAYVQYATNLAYLCNSIMLFEILHRLGTKADLLLMYPSNFHLEENTDHGDGEKSEESVQSRLLRKAADEYHVRLQPVKVQRIRGDDRSCFRGY